MKPKHTLRSFLALAGSSALLATQSANAATYYWDSNSTTGGFGSANGTWGTSTFWSTSSLGTSATANTTILTTDDINFGTAANAYAGTVTLNGAKTTNSMTFGGTGAVTFLGDSASRAITLGNGGITLASGAGAVTLGNGTATQNVTLTLAVGAQTWTNNSSIHFTINNSAAASITRTTGATLAFNKTSTGNFVMSTDHLPNDANGIVGPWAVFGTGTSQRYAFNNGGTIDAYTSGTAAAGAEDLTSDTTNYDFDGSGTNTLTANRTAHTIRYTGTGHAIDLGASGANTLTANGILAVGASGTFTIQRTGGTGTLATGSTGELVIAGPQNVSISAPISGTNLTYAGTGTLTLSGTNTYNGITTVGSGTMVIAGTSVIPTAGLVNVGGGTGTTLQLNNSITIGSLAGGGTTTTGGTVGLQGHTLTVGNATNTTYYGGFSGTSGSGIIKQGAGTLTLGAASNIPGTLAINAGTLELGMSAGAVAGGAITIGNSGTLFLNTQSSGYSTPSAGVSNTGGYTLSNAIKLDSGATTGAKLWTSQNGAKWNLTGGITGADNVAGQILNIATSKSGINGGDRNNLLISGVIANGAGTGTLGLNFAVASQSGAPVFVNLSAVNTFTGDITATVQSTQTNNWLVIGGEHWSDGTNNTPIYGKQGIGKLGGSSGIYAGNIKFGNAGNTTLAYFSSANQTLSGVIGGASANNGSLVKEGSGTLTLTNANTYTGATTVSQGTLDLGGGTANGSLASTVLNLNGGTLSYTRTGSTTQGFTTTNLTAPNLFSGTASALSVVSGNILNLGTILSRGGTFDFGSTGAGTVAADTASNVGGVIPGTTFNGTDWAVANGAGSAITAYAGSYTLTNPTTGAGDTASNYTGNNISVDSSQTPGAVITPNSLRFNTAGAYTLTLTGTTNAIASGGIMVDSTVGNSASIITGGSLLGSSNGSLLVVQNNTNTNGTLTIGSILANSGTASGLIKSGAGTLILTGANTYTGTTVINAGTLQIGNGAAGTLANSTPIVNHGSLVLNQVGAQTLAVISGTGSVTLTAGTGLVLNNSNTYSGGFTLNGGIVGSIPSGTYGGFGTGMVTINGGKLLVASGAVVTFQNSMNWNATFGFDRGAQSTPTTTWAGPITLGANVTVNSASGVGAAGASYFHIFNGGILDDNTGGRALSFTTNGANGRQFVTLNGNNTFTGNLSITQGSLTIGGSGKLGGGDYSGNITISGTTTAPITYSSSSDQILRGTISVGSSLGLTKDTSTTSTLTLAGTNSYTGPTTVNAGTLTLGVSNCLANNSNVVIGAGILKLSNSVSDSVGTLDVTAGATINLGTGASLVFANSNGVDWTGGTLNITGNFTNTSIKFATSSGLSVGQLAVISVNGSGAGTYTLDPSGYLIPSSGTPYETWATGNEPFDGDANGDGVKDGLAFLLGAATPGTNATGLLPTVTQSGGNLTLNFNCLPVSARGTAILKVAHSTNLASWTATTGVVPDATNAVPDNNVTFVVGAGPAGPPALNAVQATINSAAAGGGGKLFGRLEATE